MVTHVVEVGARLVRLKSAVFVVGACAHGADRRTLRAIESAAALASGAGLPKWPQHDEAARRVPHPDATIHDAPDTRRARYELLDRMVAKEVAEPPR